MVGGERHPVEQLLLLVLGELAALHGAGGGVLEVLAAAGDRLVVDLDADHGVPVAGEHLRDARTHGALSDHADRLEVPCHVAHHRTALPSANCVSAHAARSTSVATSAATSSAQPQLSVTPGAALAVAVHDPTLGLQPHRRAHRAQARPGGRPPGRRRARARAAGPAGRIAVAVSGDGVRLQSPSSSVPPTTTWRSRGTTYVGPLSSSHQRSRSTPSTSTTWPRTGWHVGVRRPAAAPRGRRSSRPPRRVGLRQRAQAHPGHRAAELLEPARAASAGRPACRSPAR